MRTLRKNFQKKRLITLFGIILLTVGFIELEFITTTFRNGKQDNQIKIEDKSLKNSKISGRIIIADNWSDAKADDICTGSGTFSDPYVIKDLIIDGGGIGTGIAIGSKKDYFRVENCTIFNCEIGIRFTWVCNGTLLNNNCSYNEIGVYLDGWTDIHNPTQEVIQQCYCMNNTLTNNIFNFNNIYGINMRHCENNTITNNSANNNEYGLFMTYFSNNNTIIDNYIKNNEIHGIYLENVCAHNVIKGNKMQSCGFYSYREIFLYNTIDSTNLVNGGHLYFYGNLTDLKDEDFLNAGQIHLINCNNSIISDLDLSDGSVSISLTECNNIEISYNNLSSNSVFGIEIWICSNLSIIGNLINENNQGIDGSNLHSSVISENEFNKNSYAGIHIGGHNNLITKNDIKNNWNRGLEIMLFCENNTVLDNNIENNVIGAFLVNSYSNISENVICGNLDIGLYLGGGSNDNTIFLNFFRKNGLHVGGIISTNQWNNSKIGNYWDNYTGIDGNGDGIGEIPHIISLSPLIQDYLPIVDNNPPIMTIIKPINNSKYGSSAPSFEIKVNERFLDRMWYTLDDGLHNYTFTENGTIDQNAWKELPIGQVVLRFYAIDKPGYLVFKEITLRKDAPSIDLFLIIMLSVAITVIAIISVSIILLILRRRKLIK